jgi:hypothetical protein
MSTFRLAGVGNQGRNRRLIATIGAVSGSLLSAAILAVFDAAIAVSLLAVLLAGAAVVLVWRPAKHLLYLYAALAWLLPRLYPPGLDRILPMHVVLLGSLALIWLLDSRKLPPFFVLVAAYSVGGIAAFLSGMRDLDTVNGIKFLVEACVVGPLLYLLVWSYLRDGRDAERFMLVLGTSFAMLGLLAYLLRGSPVWTPTVYEKAALRLSGQYEVAGVYLIVTPVSLSTQIAMLIPLALGIALNSRSRRLGRWATVLLFPFALLILLAGGRAGWLGALVGSSVVLLFSVRSGKAALSRGMLVALLATLFALAVLSSGILNQEIARRLSSLGYLFEDRSVVVRYPLWEFGLELLRTHPMGIGFQAFQSLTGYAVHNQYLLWGLGTGLGGLAAILLFIANWLVRSVRLLLVHPSPVPVAVICALGGMAGALISMCGDNMSTSVGWTQSTFWVLLALGASARPATQTSDVPSDPS